MVKNLSELLKTISDYEIIKSLYLMYNKYSYVIVYEDLGEMYVKAIFHDDGAHGSFHHA